MKIFRKKMLKCSNNIFNKLAKATNLTSLVMVAVLSLCFSTQLQSQWNFDTTNFTIVKQNSFVDTFGFNEYGY